MAANFWTSSHYKQLLDQEEVDVVQSLDKDRGITLEDFKLIKMHMANYILKLAQNVKVRQRVVATAITYMRRVYTRKSMTEYDPRLVTPTCLYLASKAEESTVQARLLVFYIKKIQSDEKYKYEIKHILEMEMKILEALDYYLVVFHPYRALSQLLQDAGLNDINMTQLTWSNRWCAHTSRTRCLSKLQIFKYGKGDCATLALIRRAGLKLGEDDWYCQT
ncbi:cyclin-C1-1-like isoform X3 [Cucumis melo]|uniref:B-like cyclin n=1 Tax=Cucumis melo TaxID=3656 RepID=A0ABM3KB30_CUCME|nr:cyclin-C1-1-like isoform X2 [Cucumis melo]XP_050934982.1 cyclin-C1-1-like isoform X3 [Cucumis melo]